MSKSRDYAAEARAIVAGESAQAPTREHLVALQQGVNEAAFIALLQNRLLIAVLITKGSTTLCATADLVAAIEQRHLDLNLHRQEDGSISAELVQPHARPQGSGRPN